MAKLPWRDAVLQIMRESKGAMHYRDIAEKIMQQGLVATTGATPADTVHVAIASSIHKDGDKSPFVKVAPGLFALRESQTSVQQQAAITQDERQQGVIRALGMYWDRHRVLWKSGVKLLGRQLYGSAPVDFSAQRGVYILYDGHRPIYAGRTIRDRLGTRLLEHTKDRMASRWNRFSWFGLLAVTPEGALVEGSAPTDSESLITLMESLLIEVLEPPLNRRRGDYMEIPEYMQDEDPQLRKQRLKADIDSM